MGLPRSPGACGVSREKSGVDREEKPERRLCLFCATTREAVMVSLRSPRFFREGGANVEIPVVSNCRYLCMRRKHDLREGRALLPPEAGERDTVLVEKGASGDLSVRRTHRDLR